MIHFTKSKSKIRKDNLLFEKKMYTGKYYPHYRRKRADVTNLNM